ncbi:MAG: integrase arm-type DNA-binding domain-containing protein [Methylococcaceae bacterium]|nr:integrase arm-type DNA-binding domain-containing protein [Methylococcaceae bacterium]MDZ4157646.1 integrase arm-type DNA-binding domain-containing protein [Methylococcales bacterium]MDP2393102.1 integrase arm-type DNA-binding domain-containing protein [Methylococcaceae bacterium]MDP3019246.1 integrase arm-type DNA-binding domain-containing protein [Methylococcaceae bacterium]MDP3389173.1 integrase arm-type DNA-binding domain-containing protein [Methylococcaceae bacterium]
MPLSDTAIKNAKPRDGKSYKLSDEKGLYLLVTVNGGKWWRFDYRFDGNRKTLSMGTYPDTTLKQAREKRDAARKQIADGIDPGLTRKIEKAGSIENTLAAVSLEFIEAKRNKWSASHAAHVQQCFERDVFPWIGNRPLKDLSAVEVLITLRRIVDRGSLETAARTKQFIGQAIRYGIATGRAERDVTADLRGALPSPNKGHFPAITEAKPLAQLLRDIDAYTGNFVVRTALQLQPLIFARPANLAAAEWSEFDLDAAEWRIAADKMKMKEVHIVPLSKQAIALLRDIYPLTGSSRYVFASNQGKAGNEPHISRESIGAAIRRMGYQGQHTAHGFRTTASTMLHEQGFHSDMIERQLSHGERNRVKAAYNRAQHLPERVKMLQAWADYLDGLKAGAQVIAFRKQG